ncbi:exosortase V [Parafrankia sp. BMG5.11]|uniref:exosortase V n=1 Tax=Parafrankia sp. BMG5.11 TaxID=222540 RepID=UPI00103E8C62|nr:exosortase V [Parafrankia sp. BMG5.11]TCJ34974.1 exosortase [Parafrankia sp. BMG5.11]
MSSVAAAGVHGNRTSSGVPPLAGLGLAAGMLALALPTMLFVSRESWSTEQGAHGPIVLATGVWLLHRLWPQAREVAAHPDRWRVWALLAVLLPLYVLARITQVVEVEGYLMYGALLVALYSVIGWHAMTKLWFPLFYLAFIFPPPESLVAAATTPMKMYISQAAIAFLDVLGYPIGGRGVMIYIGQYELLVAAACSGLNSIISLSAVSLFYIYIRHQANWRYAALLSMLIVPVALAANFVRVLILILLTYHFGEAAAQGFLHNFAGIMMFAAALLFIFALDEVIKKAWDGFGKAALDDASSGSSKVAS